MSIIKVGDNVRMKDYPDWRGTVEEVNWMTLVVSVPGDFGIYRSEALTELWEHNKEK